MQEHKGDESVDFVDMNKRAAIAIVNDTEEDLDSEDEDHSINHAEKPVSVQKPVAEPVVNKAAPRPVRRTRGVSLLPVRQLDQPVRISGSPPQTPTQLKPLDGSLAARTPPASNTGRHRTPSSSGPRPDPSAHTSPITSGASPSIPASQSLAVENDKLLSTYISQLATKEAHVGDLRVALSNLQQELDAAERELAEFKENGKKLAEIVHGDVQPGAVNGLKPRKQSEPETQKHMIGMGRRMVDEIGTQFWSFLEDVKSATMGNAEFERSAAIDSDRAYNATRPAPSGTMNTNFEPEPILSRPQSPPRRQVSPKRSIQNFIRNRSPSPIRNPLSPSKSPSRQEINEHRASQRLRESERLSRKLSQIDLRSPTPTNASADPTPDQL